MKVDVSRTAMLVGQDGVELLFGKHIAVFGVGGVGGYVCEALVRAGVGKIDIFDNDKVAESNLNRQIIALQSTIGMPKVKVMANRIKDINPLCTVTEHEVFYLPQNADEYPLDKYDYVIDAIDTVSAKLEIITRAKKAGVPVISAMGTGNKLNGEGFSVVDITKTSMCPLARIMRKELKKRNIFGVEVVYTQEPPLSNVQKLPQDEERETRRDIPGSISFVPGAAGLVLAGHVIRKILEKHDLLPLI